RRWISVARWAASGTDWAQADPAPANATVVANIHPTRRKCCDPLIRLDANGRLPRVVSLLIELGGHFADQYCLLQYISIVSILIFAVKGFFVVRMDHVAVFY
ncbi:MAG: hypothetical protein ACN6O5_12890, partial [Achromobacter sp.]|uniref:hypothetical protein n=1 Tax=Achromobacter sp. TaxID=134375 RepID=UPI003CFC11B7